MLVVVVVMLHICDHQGSIYLFARVREREMEDDSIEVEKMNKKNSEEFKY